MKTSVKMIEQAGGISTKGLRQPVSFQEEAGKIRA